MSEGEKGRGRYRSAERNCSGKVRDKIKRLRHWLCSSRQLLRGSRAAWRHAPSQPLMRSLLSQFQTPTAPRRAVGFFGFGSPASCLAAPITQFTLGGHDLFWPTLSTVDGAQVKRRSEKCQCRFSVQCEFIHGELWVSQLVAAMNVAREENVWDRFSTECSTMGAVCK